jgi:lipid-A-disaccharide synthase
MRYYIIAGEASGDLHGGNLIYELNKLDEHSLIRAWGGENMQREGAEIVKHYRDLAFMGFTEVLLNLPTILKNISFCKKDILEFKPDVLILIDYPGFNLRIAQFAKEAGIKVFYYISPQIWAWKQNRVFKIKNVVDRMFVILPFEKEFYHKFGIEVSFPGHPLLDALSKFSFKRDSSSDNKKNLKRVALLPGSRKQEISRILPVMLDSLKDFDDVEVQIGVAPAIPIEFYKSIIGSAKVHLFTQGTYELLTKSDVALVTSGTATLETALMNVPQIVCYKGGQISYLLAKRFIKVKYISLVNLILDKEAVPELIQGEMRRERIIPILKDLLEDSVLRVEMEKDYDKLKKILGGKGASKRAATEMITLLESRHN